MLALPSANPTTVAVPVSRPVSITTPKGSLGEVAGASESFEREACSAISRKPNHVESADFGWLGAAVAGRICARIRRTIHATMTSARKKMKILITRYQISRAWPLGQHLLKPLCDPASSRRPFLHFESSSVGRGLDYSRSLTEGASQGDWLHAWRRHSRSARRHYFGLRSSRLLLRHTSSL